MLAVMGGALGVGLAYAGLEAVLALVPPGTIPDEAEVRLNMPVLIFALAVSLAKQPVRLGGKLLGTAVMFRSGHRCSTYLVALGSQRDTTQARR